MWFLLAASVGDRMGFGNLGVGRKSKWHGSPLVHLLPHFLNLDLERLDPLCQVFDGIHFLAFGISRIRGVLLRGQALGPCRGEVLGVLEVDGKDLFQLANGLAMFLDETWQDLDIAGNDGPRERRVRNNPVNDPGNTLI